MSSDLLHRYAAGDRRALSRLLSLVARGTSLEPIREFLDRPPAKSPLVLGITGSAGVGKSTLVGQLIARARRDGRTVAVVACDPRSPITGGALLGDAVRMNAAGDAAIFIRSLAIAGGRGGVPEQLDLMVRLFANFGFDLLIVETVGAGQGDTEIREHVDRVVVLVQPNAGDDLQWEKAGLVEIADVLVVHKADLPGAEQTAAQLLAMLSLSSRPVPPIVRVSSSTGVGLDELWKCVSRPTVG